MKKVLLVLFVLLSLTACNKKFSKGEVVTAYADEVLEKLENKESFIVYVGYDDCQSCKEFKPILNQLIENYDITIYYLPTDDKQTEDQLNEIQYNYFYRMYEVANNKSVLDIF